MFKLGSIGAGHMGMAVLDGIVNYGQVKASEILVYELNPECRKNAKDRGFIVADSENEIYVNSQLLLLAVSPQACEGLLERLSCLPRKQDTNCPVIISIMAGISSTFIRKYLGPETAVVNVMPTMGMTVGQGATALSYTCNVPEYVLSLIMQVFSGAGEAVVVEEEQLREIVAVSGCMPGYVFYMIDAFAQAAEERGIEYNLAVRMVSRGFVGAAAGVLEGAAPKEMIGKVCTPGGLTAAGIASFDENKLNESLRTGLVSSILRGYELAK